MAGRGGKKRKKEKKKREAGRKPRYRKYLTPRLVELFINGTNDATIRSLSDFSLAIRLAYRPYLE